MTQPLAPLALRTYFRSTAAYRVRIALNYKGIEHHLLPVNLFKGEHKKASFLSHNPQGLLPTLEVGQSVLSQSMAILEYLEEAYPRQALLPEDNIERAMVRALAQNIACDIHPLNNLRVLKYLVNDLGLSEDDKLRWYHHWLEQGFTAVETLLTGYADSGDFCFGSTPTFADICLIPQIYNALRFDFALDDYPRIMQINKHCLARPEFSAASPENQPDFN